jgi:hypothetical protein
VAAEKNSTLVVPSRSTFRFLTAVPPCARARAGAARRSGPCCGRYEGRRLTTQLRSRRQGPSEIVGQVATEFGPWVPEEEALSV